MDCIGAKYGRLTIKSTYIKRVWVGGTTSKHKSINMARCVCECGAEREVPLSALRTGNTKSCGCYNRDLIISRNYRHGLSDHPARSIYYSMIRRCTDKSQGFYRHYGGRGISVCEEWKNSMAAFVEWAEKNGFKPGLELDRIDNDSNYESSNCRFVQREDNLNNRRNTILIDGLLLKDFLANSSEETGIPQATLRSRYFLLKKRGIEPTADVIINYK